MVVAGPKADCLTRVLGLWNMGGCLLRILRDPNPYLREIRRKSRKTPNGYVDKRDLGLSLVLPIYHIFEHRIFQPLVRPRTDRLMSMPYSGFEPGNFGAAASFPSLDKKYQLSRFYLYYNHFLSFYSYCVVMTIWCHVTALNFLW